MSGRVRTIPTLEEARAKGLDFQFFEKPVSANTLAEQIELHCLSHPYRELSVKASVA